jgi:hypothetical protein
MSTLPIRLIASLFSVWLVAVSLHASESENRQKQAVFVAAALMSERTIEVRASETATVEMVNAVRGAFNCKECAIGSISVAPTVRHVLFKGPNIESQIAMLVRDRTLYLQPSSTLDFGIVRSAALRLSKIDGIDQVIIVGIGPFSPPPKTPAEPDPFADRSDPQDPFAEDDPF